MSRNSKTPLPSLTIFYAPLLSMSIEIFAADIKSENAQINSNYDEYFLCRMIKYLYLPRLSVISTVFVAL